MSQNAARKSDRTNQLEGMVLSALFHALPWFAMIALLLKRRSGIPFLGLPGVTLVLAIAASLLYAYLMRDGGEPSFYDARLSVPQKLRGWITNRAALWQVLSNAFAVVLIALYVCVVGGF
jgi:hypothetical protein